jgi:hypothetical protein
MPLDDDEIERRIENLPSVEPPADLRSAIMGAVTAQVPLAATPPHGHRRRYAFALGWAAAAAILLTFLVIARPMITDEPVATMAPFAGSYEANGVAVTVRQSGELLFVEPVLQIDSPVSITVRWDPNALALAGVSGASDASSQNNQTTFLLDRAGQRAAVSLGVHPAARTTEVLILVDGEEAIRADVSLQ